MGPLPQHSHGLLKLHISFIYETRLECSCIRICVVNTWITCLYLLKALRRAGRFDMIIHVPPPDAEARKAILHLELSKRSTSTRALDSDWLEAFSKQYLEGYTGAEVVGVVQIAAELTRDSQCVQIDREHLLLACERLPPTTLEQYHAHLLRETSQKPSSSLSISSFPYLSNKFFFVISFIVIVILAVEWHFVTHFGLRY